MALANVLEAIRREASEEAERRLADARGRAQAIEEEARAEAARLRGQVEAEEAREGADLLRRKVQAARLEALREVRRMRDEIFREAHEEVRTSLGSARKGENYAAVLEALLAEARAALPDAEMTRIDARDVALVPDAEPCLETWGGVELEAADGRVVRNTLEERLRRAQPELRRLAARAMGLA